VERVALTKFMINARIIPARKSKPREPLGQFRRRCENDTVMSL
jgi:hypothetical protein